MGQALLKLQQAETYKKYTIKNIDHLISELSGLNLTKDMVIFNIQKYGYQVEQEYILNCLGFSVKSNRKIKVSKAVQRQAELFNFLYKVNRECYVRLRNKSSGEYRAYNVECLKDPYRLQAILKSHYFSNNVDMMYSLNCFNNMYKGDEASLFSLQNIAIDVDFNKNLYSLSKALELVKKEMLDNNIPSANLIEYGHRIRLIYTLEDVAVTRKSLLVYNKVANAIAKKIEYLGATAQPATTYARIMGSKNSKNNAIIDGAIFNPIVYKLRDLVNKVLPKLEYQASKNISKRNSKVFRITNTYELNLDRLADLEKIQKIRPNDKELLCYLYRNYCLLANMSHDEAWEKTVAFNSKFPKPKRLNKLDSETKTLNRKQYLHKGETILKLCEITLEEEEILQLKNIISKKEYMRRENIRVKKAYKEKLKLDGKMTKSESINAEMAKIKSLLEEGFKQKDILEKLNISKSKYIRLRTKLKSEGLI